MLGIFARRAKGLRQEIGSRSCGNVVNNDGNGYLFRNGAVVLIHALLGGPVVIGGHHEGCVCPYLMGMPRQAQGLGSTIRTCARDDRDALSDSLDGDLNDPVVFLMGQGGGFTRRTAGHDTVCSIFDLKFDQFPKSLFVYLSVSERRDNGNNGSF